MVSVIVPVYNLEEYIESCLKSLINQTYKDIEILCIDDGSVDKTAYIIGCMAEKEDRIKYYYQENSGVSAARNNGLKKANGDYITFVDGDDYLHNQAIELFVECAEKTCADIVFASFVETKSLDEKMKKIEGCNCREFLFKGNTLERADSIIESACCKLIRSELAKSVSFNPKFSSGEDTNYIIRTMDASQKIYYIDEVLYFYYERVNSATRKAFSLKNYSVVDSCNDLCDFLKESNNSALYGVAIKKLYMCICSCRTFSKYTPFEKDIKKHSAQIAKKHFRDLLTVKTISLKMKVILLIFLSSRHFYELARLIIDPTMKDYYKSRKKK